MWRGDGAGAGWWGRPWSLPAVAVALASVELSATQAAADHAGTRLGWGGLVLLLVGPAALLFRHRWPAAVLVVVTAATVAYYGLGNPFGPAFLALVVAVIGAVMAGYRLLAWICVGAGLGAYFLMHLALAPQPFPGWVWYVGHAAGCLVIVGIAEMLRGHRRGRQARELGRVEQERRRASEERLRIAQELHDVMAHNISVINVQAGVALHLIDQKPEQARTALTVIKQSSKEALNEMRSALAVLRGDDFAPRSPTAGLGDLDELTGRLAAAGLPVRTAVSGERRSLPVPVDLAAYRIVQEALTNVYRHARATHARVTLDFRADTLTVTVTDDGSGNGKVSDLTGGGNGIPGMRERAVSVGGSLTAGPLPAGGFRVLARFPLCDGEA